MRYEDGQVAELRWKDKGPKAVLGQYRRHSNPELDWWKVTGREGFVNPDNVEVVKTFVLIPVDGPKPTAIFTNFDLVSILEGRELTVATIGGGEIKARLATPMELIDLVDRAGRSLEAKGLPPGPGMTLDDAQRLTRPLGS